MMPLNHKDVKVGDRVSYEDRANPKQKGTVTEVLPSEWGTQYRVAFEADESQFGPGFGLAARETVSDLRQHGWNLVAWVEHT